MLRQMEYDADACQIKVVGTETFETTHRKLATLSAALRGTYRQIHAQWKKTGRLPDNLSELLRQAHESLSPETLKKIDDELGFRRTGLFDTHPSPADRIRRGRMSNEPGIFHDDRPATSLFASFEHPARFVTFLHYTDNLGIPITEKTLLHVESTQSKEAQGYASASDPAHSFFLGMLPLMLPLRIPPPAPSANLEADVAEFQQISAGLEQISEQITPMAAQFQEASQKWLGARAAARLMETGVAIDPKNFGLTDASVDSAKAAEAEAFSTRESLRQSLREVTGALNRRLQLALAIRLAGGGESDANPMSTDQIAGLVDQLNQSADDYGSHEDALDAFAVLNQINTIRQSVGETPAITRALDAQRALVNLYMTPAPNPANQVAPKPGPQLQIARQPSHTGPSEIEALRQKNQRWLADYRKNVGQLAGVALAVEKMSV
jgi:hypothetical protein